MIYETARLQRQLSPIPRTVQISCVDKALLGPPVAWVGRFFFNVSAPKGASRGTS